MNNNTKKKFENIKPFLSLIFNVLIPVLILTKYSTDTNLRPLYWTLIALAFPCSYGVVELVREKKWNFISIIGVVSVLLTGGLALFKLGGIWFAIKEAAIPLTIGLTILLLQKTRFSISKVFFNNPKIFNVMLINSSLDQNNGHGNYQKLLKKSTLMMASSFLLSAILNFVLAILILKSETGTVEFNQELGRMTALSFPVIMIPCTLVMILTLFYLASGLKKITGLNLEQIIIAK